MLETVQFAAWVAIWFLCPILIGLVLIQGGGGDMGSAFGGGGSQLDSSLGVGAVRKISKITAWLVLIFMAAVILVAIRGEGEDLDQLVKQPAVVSDDDVPVMTDAEAPAAEVDSDAQIVPVDEPVPIEAENPAEPAKPVDDPSPEFSGGPDESAETDSAADAEPAPAPVIEQAPAQ